MVINMMKGSAHVTERRTGAVRLLDYDCIGFDCDNTLCRYNLKNLMQLEYDELTKFLVVNKGYESDLLLQPLDMDFLQKGLIVDVQRGNVLRISETGQILKASHGTNFLNSSELESFYGKNKEWDAMVEFSQNIMEGWEGNISQKFRVFLDYFDVPFALVFARLVDTLDRKNGGKRVKYDLWPDMLEGIVQMFSQDNFTAGTEGFFPTLKANPDLYFHKCSTQVVDWIKSIRSANIITFLITGSHLDFVDLIVSTCLGSDWKSLFDFIVCYSRKPGYFYKRRPFLVLNNSREGNPVEPAKLCFGGVYSEGNWQDMIRLFQQRTPDVQPQCLYFGDHLIQDVYAPSEFVECHTVAIVEELEAEGMTNHICRYQDLQAMLKSNSWGSFFTSSVADNANKKPADKVDTMWGSVIKKHCKLCIPGLDAIAALPLDHTFKTFSEGQTGFYPADPIAIS